eukprot:Lithocolla_globosa_v1_NODE_2994_length_1802_cov_12.540927.p1 type:complete len:208 gc:universal NODE_2994_length_1802_cov_12.540927:362-985(+)
MCSKEFYWLSQVFFFFKNGCQHCRSSCKQRLSNRGVTAKTCVNQSDKTEPFIYCPFPNCDKRFKAARFGAAKGYMKRHLNDFHGCSGDHKFVKMVEEMTKINVEPKTERRKIQGEKDSSRMDIESDLPDAENEVLDPYMAKADWLGNIMEIDQPTDTMFHSTAPKENEDGTDQSEIPPFLDLQDSLSYELGTNVSQSVHDTVSSRSV